MTRWYQRLSKAGMEKLLEQMTKAGLEILSVLQRNNLNKLIVDTTTQEKTISYPTDAKLFHRMRGKLVDLSKEFGVEIRQSYTKKSKYSLFMRSRYAHGRQMRRANTELKYLNSYLGRVVRGIERTVLGNKGLKCVFPEPLSLGYCLLSQRRQDKNKIYSIHAPEVECISKGNAHNKYEFSSKMSVAITSKKCFIVGMKAHHGNPYDRHTSEQAVAQTERVSRFSVSDIYVNRGYRGHNYKGQAVVHIAGIGYRN